jgi:hypothetical protein
MTFVLADGQPVDLGYLPANRITAIVHPGDMTVEAPDHFPIGPEQTIECSRSLEQDQWEQIRAEPNFVRFWDILWGNQSVPPEVLAKGNLATRHAVGLILLILKARAEGLKMHIMYPETYLHPMQQRMLMSLIHKVAGKPLNSF